LRISRETWVFAVLLGLHVLPLWIFRFVPTQDGPAHQSIASILREIGAPGGAYLRDYFVPQTGAFPNWFVYATLARVLGFLPIPLAEKVLLSAYVVLLPVSFRYALGGVDRRAVPFAALSLPFVYGFHFWMGFYNFCFGVAGFFLVLGWWLRYRERLGAGRTIVLALLLLGVYFCHPVPLVLSAVSLLTLAGWWMLFDLKGKSPWKAFGKWLAPPLLASMPALLLLGAYLGNGKGTNSRGLEGKSFDLVTLRALVALDDRAIAVTCALAALVAAAAVMTLLRRIRQRGIAPEDGLAALAVVLTAVYFLAPNKIGIGDYVLSRISLFPWLILILWCATATGSRPARRAIPLAAAALAVALLGLVSLRWAALDDQLAEYASAASRIEPRRTVLSLSFANAGRGPDGGELSDRTEPFVHAAGHITVRSRSVDLGNYAGRADCFPIALRPDRDPSVHFVPAELEAQPPRVGFASYSSRTGGSVDYVLLWSVEASPPNHPALTLVRDQLAGYERIYVSPNRLAQLYCRKGLCPQRG
jgi:hypothetical protein